MHHSPLEHNINAAIRFFLCLIIFWLPYSPAVIESSVIAGLFLWVFKRSMMCYRLRGGLAAFRLPATPLNKPIFVFGTVCVLSSISSPFWQESFPKFLTKTLEWFIVYFLVVESVTKRKHIYIISGIFIFTLLATVFDSLIQYYVTYKDIFLGHVIKPGARATAGFKTPNGLGAYLAGAVPIVFAWIFKRNKGPRHRLLFVLLWLLVIWALIVTFSRGAWGAAFFGILFFMLLYKGQQRRLEFCFILGLLLVLAVLLACFGFILTSDWDIPSLRHDTITWRFHMWQDVFGMIQDSWLLGHGINTFMQIFEAYRTDTGGSPTYAHNSYLQLMAETGLIGLVSFLCILGSLFRRLLSCLTVYGIKNDDLIVPAMGLWSGIFAFLLQSFSDNHFYSLQLSVYLWFMVGLLVVMAKETRWQNSNGH